ncbi:MAG: YlxR family protein [Firmicutes bacterium]|nr:YlxR family protein [Bacillota bacterium]
MPKPRKVPQRTCVGCGKVCAKKELVRIVRTPEGEVVVDPTGKKSGRGAYVCPSPDCLARATKGNRLARALDAEVAPSVLKALESQITGVDE